VKRKHRRQTSEPVGGRPSWEASRSHPFADHEAGKWIQSPWLLGFLIFVAILLAYQPALHGGFIWDDDSHISSNPALHSLAGLRAIWTTPGTTMQYYPLSFTVWWMDYHLWKLNTLGFHLQNIFLHALVAVLLWQVLKRLRVPGAWLAGAIFALHPVNVMSVAWMTELKNTLSCSLALMSVWAYLRFAGLGVYAPGPDGNSKSRPWRFYVLSLVLFLLAMCAKTAVSFLPASLLLVAWWQRDRLRWREVWPLLPMIGMVATMGQMTFYVEHHSGGATGPQFNIDWIHRVLISGRSFWFYLGRLFFPHQLTFIYPRWDVEPGVWWQWLFPLATAGALMGVWLLRKRIGKGIFAALLHFYIGTSLLILMVVLYMTQYSFVSDHWQYFGCMSVMTLVAAGITMAFGFLGTRNPWLRPVFCGALLLTLGVLTWQQCKMYADVETLWRTTIRLNPDCWMAHNNLGIVFVEQGRTDEAINQYHEAIRIKPDDAFTHNNLGNALLKMGSVDEAITQFQQALQIKPDSADVHNNLGNALLQKGSVDEAITQYQQALQIKPDYAEAHNNFGNALLQKGSVDEAITQFQRALQIDPDYAEANNNLYNALLTKGNVNEAIVYYQQILQINPANAEAHYNLGNALFQKGDVDEAIIHYQRALQINPDSAEAHLNLGIALLKKGKVDEAIAHFQQALQIQPDYAEAHNNIGYALFLKGRADNAIAHYQKALQIKPGYAEAHYNLGYALLQKGNVAEAIAHYQQALEIKPDYADAHLNLGNALLQKGNVAEAIAHYQKALQIKPDYLEVQNNLAWVLATAPQASLRNGRQAVELAQRANQLAGGENLIILHTLAAAYAEAGRFDDARQSVEKALELARAAGRQDLVAQLSKELNLYDRGLPFHLENK